MKKKKILGALIISHDAIFIAIPLSALGILCLFFGIKLLISEGSNIISWVLLVLGLLFTSAGAFVSYNVFKSIKAYNKL